MLKKIYYILIICIVLFLFFSISIKHFANIYINWLFILCMSFLLAQILTPAAKYIAFKVKALDVPDKRKIHKVPIPRLGGLAIFISFIAMLKYFNCENQAGVHGLLLGCSLIVLIGIIDDIKGVSAVFKLMVQVAASIIVVSNGIRITFIPGFFLKDAIEILISMIWIIGITNAINFLDGMDGLATGLSVIASLSIFLVVVSTGQYDVTYLSIALLGSCIGFLPYNFKPAKIFLGDSGSTFLGFILACLAIMVTWPSQETAVAISMPILIFSVPIFDMIYTTVSRFKNKSVRTLKEWLEYVGKDHFHHRLVHIGFSDIMAVIFIYASALSLGLSAVALTDAGDKAAVLLLCQAVLIFFIIVTLMLAGREKY